MDNKPMKLLILEDDEVEIKRFTSSINARKELELVVATNSSFDAIRYIKTMNVEGIIVDIELNKGIGGSGLDFLKELNELELDKRPIVIVTTQNESDLVRDAARSLKVDMIYCKNKEDYTPNIILNQFLTLRPFSLKRKTKSPNTKIKIETEIERKKRIENMITEELNLIGIPTHMKGSAYIFDAILYLIENAHKDDSYYTNYLYNKYKVRKGGISTSIQDAINNAWRNTPADDILEHFTANITYKNGTPTPTQFIHYYADKIKKSL